MAFQSLMAQNLALPKGRVLLGWLAGLLLGHTVTMAAPTCPSDADILTVEGVGTVYSSGGYEVSSASSRFVDACLERDAWIIRFPILTIVGEGENAILNADSATLETDGASARIVNVNGPVSQLRFGAAALSLSSRYDLIGLPRGDYTANAVSGSFKNTQLKLAVVVLDRLQAAKPIERYNAASLELNSDAVTLTELRFVTNQFAVTATDGSRTEAGLALREVTGLFGRNAGGSELTFSAVSALRLSSGGFQLNGVTLKVFGLSVGLGSVIYDPACPPELPLAFSPAAGLTLGLDNVRLSCDGSVRATIIGHDLFSATREYTAFLTARQGSVALFVGQRRDETAKIDFASLPEVGLGAQLQIDSGQNIEQTLDAERFIEMRGQVSTALEAFGVRFTPRLEFGASGQSRSSRPDAFLPFARGHLGIVTGWTAGALRLSSTLTSNYTVYSDGSSAANGTAGLSVGVALGDLSAAVGLRYAQQFVTAPIVRHNLSDLTRLDASLRFTPRVESPTLGYAGVRLEQPVFGLSIEYDLRTALFVRQLLELSARVALYDGLILTDHFGAVFQTPAFALALNANFDFVPLTGEVGTLITFYGPALTYNFGAYIAVPSNALRFSISLGLR